MFITRLRRPALVVAIASALLTDCLPAPDPDHAAVLGDEVLEPRNSILEARQQPGTISPDKFLRRAYHASAIGGKYLYIDGGQFSYMNNDTAQYYYATATLSLDMSKDWTNDTVNYITIPKPSGVPNLSNGNLWYHESEDTLYMGLIGDTSSFTRSTNPPRLSLWSLKSDGAGSGTWSSTIDSSSNKWRPFERPSSSLQSFGPDNAWVLGGTDQEGEYLPGLVKFDMVSKQLTNGSAEGTGMLRARGRMQYVPNFGSGGVHIALGGALENGKLADTSRILVFDPTVQRWYNQSTTGSPPANRVDLCMAGAPSSEETYEIFVYGGDNGNLGKESLPYDTIHILTLPAFHWIQVPYPNGDHPRHGMTCHGVGGSQILVVGGADSNPPDPKSNLDKVGKSKLESLDPWKQGLGVFDLQTFAWADHYAAQPAPYTQNDAVKSYYGGQGPEDINKLTTEVSALMNQKNFVDVPKAGGTSSASTETSSSSNTGAIAGGVVGGVGGIAIIGLGAWLIWRRRQRKKQSYDYTPAQGTNLDEMYKYGSPGDVGSDAGGGRTLSYAPPDYKRDPNGNYASELHSQHKPVELTDGAVGDAQGGGGGQVVEAPVGTVKNKPIRSELPA